MQFIKLRFIDLQKSFTHLNNKDNGKLTESKNGTAIQNKVMKTDDILGFLSEF